jgi:hypothetical protein
VGYLVVPQDLDPQGGKARLWLGAFDPEAPPGPAELRLESPGDARSFPVAAADWKPARTTPPGKNAARLFTHRVVATALAPATEYRAELVAGDGRVLARGRFTTLPLALPAEGERPLRLYVGSCFDYRRDGAGDVGRTYRQLAQAHQRRPDLKVLCGDQVYLDVALGWFWGNLGGAWHEDDPAWFEDKFLATYRATWQQEGAFADLLADGATLLSSDDHEFWNNYPSWSPLALGGGRGSEWEKATRRLYDAIQADRAVLSFDLPGLSLFVADTRVHRDGEDFMAPADFERLLAWTRGLDRPGVLVVGQPILASRHDGILGKLKGTLGDWALPDFDRQYPRLVRALREAPHSVIALTGDVHFGRVGVTALDPVRGTELVEIVSSPLALVDEKARGKWGDSPALFPADPIPGVARTTVAYTRFLPEPDDPKRAAELFVVVELTREGSAMWVRAWAHPVRDRLLPPEGLLVCERKLL